MNPRSCAAVALLAVAMGAAAEPAGDKPAAPTQSPVPGEPAVRRTAIEDDGVRIEETRVRGQVTRVVVRSKQLDVKAYELLIGTAARDPSQRGQASGQRVWHILSF